ncbi:MAG: hypothetical protein RLZZ176_2338, partial [Cyanobacteriota bacterium]
MVANFEKSTKSNPFAGRSTSGKIVQEFILNSDNGDTVTAPKQPTTVLENDPLKTVTKSRPCLMCGGEDKCAISDSGNTLLCGRSSAKVGDIVNGYRCKSTSNPESHCSHTFVKVNKTRQSTTKPTAKPAKPTKPAMSRDDRDLWNRKIISTLRLSESDRTHLRNVRGLTDQQIDNWGFRSVGVNQRLVGNDWPDNLPGYRHDKKNLAISGAGILTPIKQLDQIVAFKVRLSEKKENQRYTCVSDKKYTSYHIDGEQPLAVLVNDNNDFSEGTWVSEGSEIKPVIVHHKYNSPVLGGGRFWHTSKNHAAKFLPLVREKSEIINLAVDAGDILHDQGIPSKWIREYKYFENQGFSPRFAWWGQVSKESNDIDELDSLDNIEFINLDQFKELVKEHNPEAYQKIVDDESSSLLNKVVNLDDVRKKPIITFNQIGFDSLYEDQGYIYVNDNFYQWQGDHYKIIENKLELKRIQDFCNNFSIKSENKDGESQIKYPFANTKSVNELHKWSQMGLTISSDRFTQTKGINCKNGVLSIKWVGREAIPHLEPHDPQKHFFTDEPIIYYDPKADPKNCDQLLSCLSPSQQEILMRNLGASLDLPKVRKFKGRTVKILFAVGTGSNGKDSLREVLNLIYGMDAVTDFSLNDFIAYDKGSKNDLAGLSKARVNWASENDKTPRLDNSASLKRLATGNILKDRYLFKDGTPYRPNSVAIFSLNELPNIYGTGQAASSRFAALMFDKTYVDANDFDPNNPNHVLADPKFANDPEFLINEVAPAFLNRMIKGLQDLMADGIDYSASDEAMESIRSASNHLFDFINEMGWEEDPNAPLIRVSTLYEQLETWYVEQGILVRGELGRNIWQDPVRPSDQYVKGSNQLFDRLKAIFPDIEKEQKTPLGHPKKVPHIKGLSICLDKPKQLIIPKSTPKPTPPTPIPTPVDTASSLDTARVLPTTPTPVTPVLSESFKNNFKEKIDPNFRAKTSLTIPQNSADDDGTVENEEVFGATGVTGVDHAPETLTTQGLQPLQTGVGTGVGSGVETGVGSTDVSPSIGDRTIEDLTSQIKVVDPREKKQQEFTQEQLAEN